MAGQDAASGWGRNEDAVAVRHRVLLGIVVSAVLGCPFGPPRVRVELTAGPVTLSAVPRSFTPGEALRADNESVSVCVYPAREYALSGRWTVLTPDGREAQLVGRAELVNGRVVALPAPSFAGRSLCVHPRLDGPLEAAVQRLSLVASTPIVVDRIVWQSTPR